MTKKEIDSTKELKYNNGHLVIRPGQESFSAIQKNNSISSKIILRNTIFSNQNPTPILKYYKGHLIVNNKIGDDS